MRLLVTCSLLLFSFPASLVPCTRIFWNDNGIARVTARSMDLYINEHPMLALLPPGLAKNGDTPENPLSWKSKYASIVVTAFGKAVSDGMNDQGLAAHVLYLHQSAYEKRDSQRPGLSNARWVEYTRVTSNLEILSKRTLWICYRRSSPIVYYGRCRRWQGQRWSQ